jgi:hypothetical protein
MKDRTEGRLGVRKGYVLYKKKNSRISAVDFLLFKKDLLYLFIVVDLGSHSV